MANTVRQYYTGGADAQLMAGAAGPTGYNQYAPGGTDAQLRAAAGMTAAFDQYAAGGPMGQLIAAGVAPPTGPTMPQPGQTTFNPWVPGPTGG